MAQLLVRQLDDDTIKRLKDRARRHRRSMEAEIRLILTEAVLEPRDELENIRVALHAKRFGDSSELLCENLIVVSAARSAASNCAKRSRPSFSSLSRSTAMPALVNRLIENRDALRVIVSQTRLTQL